MTAPKCPTDGNERKGAFYAAHRDTVAIWKRGSVGGEGAEPGEGCCVNRVQWKLCLLEQSASATIAGVWPGVEYLCSFCGTSTVSWAGLVSTEWLPWSELHLSGGAFRDKGLSFAGAWTT